MWSLRSMIHKETIPKIVVRHRFMSYYKNLTGVLQVNVNSFTSKPFHGNPAAVVFSDQQKEITWMQKIAIENNIPVTAFVSSRPCESQSYDLRWFTPTQEISLCGHATLATAHAIYEQENIHSTRTLEFHTQQSGLLKAKRNMDSGMIELNFPSTVPSRMTLNADDLGRLKSSLGINKSDITYSGCSGSDLIIEVTPKGFTNIPKIVEYSVISSIGGRGVVITAWNDDKPDDNDIKLSSEWLTKHNVAIDMKSDFWLRCFYPNIGLNEDFATGSALCALAPHYSNKINQNDKVKQRVILSSYQASSRGGHAMVEHLSGGVEGSETKEDRVRIAGHCVTVSHSQLLV